MWLLVCFLISLLQCLLSSTLGFALHTLSILVLSHHSAEGVLAGLAMKFLVFSVHQGVVTIESVTL